MMVRKTFFKLCLLLLVFSLILNACEKNKMSLGGVDDTGASPDLVINNENLNAPNKGGDMNVIILASSNWEAGSNVDWINVVNKTGEKGKDTINIVINENESEARSGKITVSLPSMNISEEIIISQESGISLNWFVKEGGTGEGHSWNTATDLGQAIKNSASGDTIFVAAGTYTPKYVIEGGDQDDSGDLTFGIDKNITIIGGYPTNSTLQSEPDPENNETILSGDLGGIKAYHVVSIYAAKNGDEEVRISGITIKHGIALGDNSVSLAGLMFSRNKGGGLIIGDSKVSLDNVLIVNNQAYQSAGIEAIENVELTMKNCSVSENTANSNGGGVHLANSSVAFVYNSRIENNKASVGAGLYVYPKSELYLYNSIVNNNDGGSNTGIGIYYREGSSGYIVNSQVTKNKGKGGVGLQLYLNSKVQVISSTFSDNVSTGSNGGFRIYDNGNEFSIYNSIVSGNEQHSGKDYVIETDKFTIRSSVLASDVLGNDGNSVTGAMFNPVTMLNDKYIPVGDNNPAVENGMGVEELNTINSSIDKNYLKIDINGKSRGDMHVMGAFIP